MSQYKTIDYYNTKAAAFIQDTEGAEMNSIQEEFLAYVKDGGRILDLGCGSGRDSKAFLDAGFSVTAVDGSEEMCKNAARLTGLPVQCVLFQEFVTDELYDGIWACSSLLHLNKPDIHDCVARLSGNLKTGGCFYLSFKYGEFEGERNGRYFTDMTAGSMEELLGDIGSLRLLKYQITGDVRPGREDEKWLNVFYERI